MVWREDYTPRASRPSRLVWGRSRVVAEAIATNYQRKHDRAQRSMRQPAGDPTLDWVNNHRDELR